MIPLKTVDQILRDHGLTRENAKQYVGRCAAYNKRDIAEDTGVSEDTVHRYKREFQAMDTATRCRVVAVLAAELYSEITDTKLNVSAEGEA